MARESFQGPADEPTGPGQVDLFWSRLKEPLSVKHRAPGREPLARNFFTGFPLKNVPAGHRAVPMNANVINTKHGNYRI